MKTYKQFCIDANIQENWFQDRVRDTSRAVSGVIRNVTNTFSKPKPPVAKPKPQQPVLAYYQHRQGFGTGSNWKPGRWTPEQIRRYGWKPVQTSSYGPGDTPSQSYNTGKDKVQRTASGTVFTPSSTGVAVPYKYKKGEVPKGTWAGTPSTPFGTQLQLTQKPTGTNTRVTNAPVVDTGNFGPAGEVNRTTGLDLMQTTARQLTGRPNLSPTEYGKRTVYVRTAPQPTSVAKPKPQPKK